MDITNLSYNALKHDESLNVLRNIPMEIDNYLYNVYKYAHENNILLDEATIYKLCLMKMNDEFETKWARIRCHYEQQQKYKLSKL